MKKIGLITILLLITMTLTSCGLKQNPTQGNTLESQNNEKESMTDLENDNNYELLTETSVYKGFKIKFPQVANMVSTDNQKKINELIRKEVYSFVDNYWPDDYDEYLGSGIEYTIKLRTSEFLSIHFSGEMFESERYSSSVPVSYETEYYTVNIDLNKAKIVRFKDLVRIDENLVEKLKISNHVSVETGYMLDFNEYTTQEWIKILDEADSKFSSAYHSYLTEDSIGISLTDLDEYEIKYKDIKNNILGDYYFWSQVKE